MFAVRNYYDDAMVDDPKDTQVDYLVKTNLERNRPLDGPDNVAMDLSLSQPFLTHQPGYGYSQGEFLVVAKKVHAVVYLPEHDDPQYQANTSEEINHIMNKVKYNRSEISEGKFA